MQMQYIGYYSASISYFLIFAISSGPILGDVKNMSYWLIFISQAVKFEKILYLKWIYCYDK